MENISDTEVVVNIKLDAHQNKLLAVDLIFQGIALINCEGGVGRPTRRNCQCLWRWGQRRAVDLLSIRSSNFLHFTQLSSLLLLRLCDWHRQLPHYEPATLPPPLPHRQTLPLASAASSP